MDSANIRIRYRPIRLGWCVRDQSLDDLRRAIRLSNVLRGGIFNPIIPIGREEAPEIIRRFRVDALLQISDDEASKEFVDSFGFLPWPLDSDSLFTEKFGQLVPTLLDVSHTLDLMANEYRNYRQIDSREAVSIEKSAGFAIVRWEEDDPLKDLLLASFGAYPHPNEIHRDYEAFIQSNLLPFNYRAQKGQPLPASLFSKDTPCTVTDHNLKWDRSPAGPTFGFYVGSAQSFDDLVNFWNLRVSGVRAVFLDPAHSDRLALWREKFAEDIAQLQSQVRMTDKTIAVWSGSQEAIADLKFNNELVPHFHQVSGLKVLQGNRYPPLHYIAERGLLGNVSDRLGRKTLTFQLPEKPIAIEDPFEYHEEHFIVSVTRTSSMSDDPHTFWAPFIPEMNKWVGQHSYRSSRKVRVELDGIGIICPITAEHLEIYAIPKLELTKQFFNFAGIKAEPSPSGRVATRLISQLGGLQGCRVLKPAGVRRLIKEYGALQEVSWKKAIQTIAKGTKEHPQPEFKEYEELFIEPRSMKSKLTPEDVLHYLLERRVFRPGLNLKCPKCELAFWVQLDEVATDGECVYCGNRFNCTRQLKRDPWRYRKSGLFGLDNNQEGSVPVALTLQQLDTHLRDSSSTLMMTNLNLDGGSESSKCETDLFVAVQQHDRVSVGVGECKDSKGKISNEDVGNMTAVINAFPSKHFDRFLIFAKTAPFTKEEVDCCKLAQVGAGHPRVILLSDRELEPYDVYDRAAKDFEVDPVVISLGDLARSTHQLYFDPRPKQPPKNS